MTNRPTRRRRTRKTIPTEPGSIVGIMTATCILAVGITAAYTAIALGLLDESPVQPHRYLVMIAVIGASISMVAFFSTMFFSLTALNLHVKTLRAKQITRATIALYLQSLSGTVFVLLVILGALFVAIGNGSSVSQSTFEPAKTPDELFADARNLYADALGQIEQGNLRQAAELAWGSTKQATDALILARTDREPTTVSQTSSALEELSYADDVTATLMEPYYSRLIQLHYFCFYDGTCDRQVEKRIRETADFIRNAEHLANK